MRKSLVVVCCLAMGCTGPDASPMPTERTIERSDRPAESLTLELTRQQRAFFRALASDGRDSAAAYLASGFRMADATDPRPASPPGPFSPDSRASYLRLLANGLPHSILEATQFEVLPVRENAAAVVTKALADPPTVAYWMNQDGTWKIYALNLNVPEQYLTRLRDVSSSARETLTQK